eukprot:3190672-Pleurochrysis_carterae.AAC.1
MSKPKASTKRSEGTATAQKPESTSAQCNVKPCMPPVNLKACLWFMDSKKLKDARQSSCMDQPGVIGHAAPQGSQGARPGEQVNYLVLVQKRFT